MADQSVTLSPGDTLTVTTAGQGAADLAGSGAGPTSADQPGVTVDPATQGTTADPANAQGTADAPIPPTSPADEAAAAEGSVTGASDAQAGVGGPIEAQPIEDASA